MDHYVATENLLMPPERALQDPALLPQVIEATRSFSWTRGYLSATGWLDWFTNLPLEVRLTLPDGTCLLGAHASPGKNDGPSILPRQTNAYLAQRLAGCEADLIIVGHTHMPLDRHAGSIHVINLGSVSNPITPGLQATYARLEADAHGYHIQLQRVEYDREVVIKAIAQSGHPTPSFLQGYMQGEHIVSSDLGFFQSSWRAGNQQEQ